MRLIDGDKLYKRIKTEANPYGKPTIDVQEGLKVMGIIEQMPTVEAEPVRHGHWITGRTAVHGYLTSTCSVCKQEITGKIGGKIEHIYMGDAVACPLCGAKMDGKENG